jgi:hypothetical protein
MDPRVRMIAAAVIDEEDAHAAVIRRDTAASGSDPVLPTGDRQARGGPGRGPPIVGHDAELRVGLSDKEIEAKVGARVTAKKAKNFAESDRIRDELKAAGLMTEDDYQRLVREADAEVAEAVAFAEASEWEPVEDLLRHVYAEAQPS